MWAKLLCSVSVAAFSLPCTPLFFLCVCGRGLYVVDRQHYAAADMAEVVGCVNHMPCSNISQFSLRSDSIEDSDNSSFV